MLHVSAWPQLQFCAATSFIIPRQHHRAIRWTLTLEINVMNYGMSRLKIRIHRTQDWIIREKKTPRIKTFREPVPFPVRLCRWILYLYSRNMYRPTIKSFIVVINKSCKKFKKINDNYYLFQRFFKGYLYREVN